MLALRDPDIIGQVVRARLDVLWVHGYHTVVHQLAIATQMSRGGDVLIREEQTLLNQRTSWKSAVKAAVLRPMMRRAYGLYLGSENRRWFEAWGMRPERLFWTPYAVDNDALRAAAAELAPRRTSLRRELGIADAAGPVLLTVGRLVPKKQPLALLDAFKQLREHTPCSLLIVGTGELGEAMRRRIEEADIPDVHMAGFLNQHQIARAYAASDLFVLLSKEHETWGLVVNEAMNFGLPVVVSDMVGSGADLVMDGETGFVVPHDDTTAFIAACTRLLSDSKLRDRLGAQARSHIAQWNYDATARGVLAAVDAATAARAGR